MPKTKTSTKKKTTAAKTTPRKKTTTTALKSKAIKKDAYSEEYAEYLERYEIYGEGRPRLSQADFDRYDDELLDLLALEAEHGLNDDQIVRLQELEFLLLDSEQ